MLQISGFFLKEERVQLQRVHYLHVGIGRCCAQNDLYTSLPLEPIQPRIIQNQFHKSLINYYWSIYAAEVPSCELLGFFTSIFSTDKRMLIFFLCTLSARRSKSLESPCSAWLGFEQSLSLQPQAWPQRVCLLPESGAGILINPHFQQQPEGAAGWARCCLMQMKCALVGIQLHSFSLLNIMHLDDTVVSVLMRCIFTAVKSVFLPALSAQHPH